MRLLPVVLALLIASFGAARADDPAWASFADPTENAFTLEAPKGWQVTGGEKRVAPLMPKPWVAATSPDGAGAVFMGDPAVPLFLLPDSKAGLAAGKKENGAFGPTLVAAYRSAAQFGIDYGKKTWLKDCTGVKSTGTKPRSDLVRIMLRRLGGEPPPGQSFDSAEIDFSCTKSGQSYKAAVMTVISRLDQPDGEGGNWIPVVLFGFRAPEAEQAAVQAAAEHMFSSVQPNKEWTTAVHEAMTKRAD
jgi:hypothetical protein